MSQSASAFVKASKSFQSSPTKTPRIPLAKDSSTKSTATRRLAESISQSKKKLFPTSSSAPRIVTAKEKTISSTLAKGSHKNSMHSLPRPNHVQSMSERVKKPTATEKSAEKLLLYVPKPILESDVAMKKKGSKYPSNIPIRSSTEPSMKVPKTATPILHSKTALNRKAVSKRPSKIPVKSFQIEADLMKPYQPPKPIWLSRIALLKKQSSKLVSKIPVMKHEVVKKKSGRCLLTPVNKCKIAVSKSSNSKYPSRIPIRQLSSSTLQKETKMAVKIQNLKEKEMSTTVSEVNLRYEL